MATTTKLEVKSKFQWRKNVFVLYFMKPTEWICFYMALHGIGGLQLHYYKQLKSIRPSDGAVITSRVERSNLYVHLNTIFDIFEII